MRRDMTIFVYLCSGLPERQGSKMASVTGEGINYLVLIRKVYIYLFIKYIYYKDLYFIISNNYSKKRAVIKKIKNKK